MKIIKKEYTTPKAEVIEFECEDVITASLTTRGYTRVGTKSWFEGLGGNVGAPASSSWTDSIGNGQ